MKKTNYIAELSFLAVLLLIAVAFLTQLTETEQDALQVVDAVEYARVLVGLFAVTLVAVSAQSLHSFSKYLKANPTEEAVAAEERAQTLLSWKLIAATGILFFFYCFSMKRLGYYTTGFIVLEIYQLILYKAQEGRLDKKGIAKITAISAGVVIALYLVFSIAFELYLPRGILL